MLWYTQRHRIMVLLMIKSYESWSLKLKLIDVYIHLWDKNTDVVLLPSASVIMSFFHSYNIGYKAQTHFSAPPQHPCPVLSILAPTSFELENYTNYPNTHMKLKACFFLATGWAVLPTHINKHACHWNTTPRPEFWSSSTYISFFKTLIKVNTKVWGNIQKLCHG